MPNFVNKTSSVFFLLLGFIVGLILVFYFKNRKLKKATEDTLKYKVPEVEPETLDEDPQEDSEE